MRQLLVTLLLGLVGAYGQEFVPYTVTTKSVPKIYLPNQSDIRVDVEFKKPVRIKRRQQLEIMGKMRESRDVKYLAMTAAPDNADNVTGIQMVVAKKSCISKTLGIFSRMSRFVLSEFKAGPK
jgi:hypothetical protein